MRPVWSARSQRRLRAPSVLRYAAALLALLALVGCQTTSVEGPADPSPTSTAAAPSGTTDPSSSGTDGPPEATDTVLCDDCVRVPPAAGPVLDTEILKLRFPKGYKRSDLFAPDIYEATRPGGTDHRVEYATGDLLVEGSLPYLMGLSEKFAAWEEKPTRLPPVTIDGVRCFRLQGRQYGLPTEAFGTQRGPTQVWLTFSIQEPPAKRQQIIDSVVATVRWKAT